MNQLLLFITAHPREASFSNALAHAQKHLRTHKKLTVFFYADAAYIANAYNWQPANEPNLQKAWQALANTHDIPLNVCVSTALSRGITDVENSKRHQIFAQQTTQPENTDTPHTQATAYAHNLAAGFELVGLGTLAELMHQADDVQQF